MIKASLSAALLVGFCAVAQAAPPAPGKQVASTSSGQTYWLGDGLNRLVFWRPPAEARAEARAAR